MATISLWALLRQSSNFAENYYYNDIFVKILDNINSFINFFYLIFTFYCIKIHSVLKKQYLPLPCWINQDAPPTSNFQPIRLLDPGYWYKFTNKMTNSADPDQLASSEANWSRSTLLDVHCLQRQGISRFSKTRVNNFYLSVWSDMLHRYGVTLISKITWWIIHRDDAKHHIQLYYPKMCMKSLSLEISWFCDFFWRQVFDVRYDSSFACYCACFMLNICLIKVIQNGKCLKFCTSKFLTITKTCLFKYTENLTTIKW